jgi:ADP-ribose pyrophosphatase
VSRYETISSKNIFKGKILSVNLDELRMPSGRIVERETIAHGGAVGIVPLTDNGEIVMVSQYRHPVGGMLLEIPAGKLDPGETPEECARRELIEEIGLAPGRLVKMATFYTTPGYSNEIFHLFLADGLTPEHSDLTEEEIESVVRIPMDDAVRMISDGTIEDGKTIAAVGLAKIRLEAAKDGRIA